MPVEPPDPRPDYRGLSPASAAASRAARGASKKRGTRCELRLRRALWSRGCRYRLATGHLPGKPDLVFPGPRLAVFCDGDFWHGRDWESRREKLLEGHNAGYWIAKIERNRRRDAEVDRHLGDLGWTVVRVWESQIHRQLDAVVDTIVEVLRELVQSR
ncbi:MAG: very short patch repair endonuclease [Holophagales bacterium]|nr:very short patch repair endonuclease [Holophagales bacterium]